MKSEVMKPSTSNCPTRMTIEQGSLQIQRLTGQSTRWRQSQMQGRVRSMRKHNLQMKKATEMKRRKRAFMPYAFPRSIRLKVPLTLLFYQKFLLNHRVTIFYLSNQCLIYSLIYSTCQTFTPSPQKISTLILKQDFKLILKVYCRTSLLLSPTNIILDFPLQTNATRRGLILVYFSWPSNQLQQYQFNHFIVKKYKQYPMSKKQIAKSPEAPKSGFDPKKYAINGVSEEEVVAIKAAFDLFDSDQGGSIDIKELKAAMTSLGFQTKSQAIFQMISDLDADGNGAIDFGEWLSLMTKKVNDRDSRTNINKIFVLFDDDRKGYISGDNLRRVAHQLGEHVPEEEIQELIKRADTDQDGGVSAEEFYVIITRKIKD